MHDQTAPGQNEWDHWEFYLMYDYLFELRGQSELCINEKEIY